MILKYCDMFLKLKDLCDSPTFKEADSNHDGTVFPKDFKIQLEKSKKYTRFVPIEKIQNIYYLNILLIQRGGFLPDELQLWD